MSGEIEIIMKITECSLEQATEAFNTFSNVEDACDYLIFLGDAPPQAKRRKLNLTPEQEEIAKVRKVMEEMDAKHEARVTSANQPASSG